MLSVWKLAQGQEDYYLEAVAQGVEDYYLGGEAPAAGSPAATRWSASPARCRPTTSGPSSPAMTRHLGHGSDNPIGCPASTSLPSPEIRVRPLRTR